MNTNNYSRYTVTNFTGIYWMPTLYLVLCRRTGGVGMKDKPCLSRRGKSSGGDRALIRQRLTECDECVETRKERGNIYQIGRECQQSLPGICDSRVRS